MHATQNPDEESPINSIEGLTDVNLESHVPILPIVEAIDSIGTKGNAHVYPTAQDESKLIRREDETNKTSQASSKNLCIDFINKVTHNNGSEIRHKNGVFHFLQ